MKMTMIIKDSQTNKSSLIYITYVFLKFSKISTLKNLWGKFTSSLVKVVDGDNLTKWGFLRKER